MHRSSPHSRHATGFSLLEVMIALVILGILLGVGVPHFRDALWNVRISAQANDLMTDLSVARSEAVKRNLPVFLCASDGGAACNGARWSEGWMLFVDEDNDGSFDAAEPVLKSRRAAEGSNSIVATAGVTATLAVSYRPTGRLGGDAAVAFVICDTRTETTTGRTINIVVTGRPLVSRTSCAAPI